MLLWQIFVCNYDRKEIVEDYRQIYVEITKNCHGIEIADERLRFLHTKHLQCIIYWSICNCIEICKTPPPLSPVYANYECPLRKQKRTVSYYQCDLCYQTISLILEQIRNTKNYYLYKGWFVKNEISPGKIDETLIFEAFWSSFSHLNLREILHRH